MTIIKMLSTKEVAKFLGVNEKMVYTLIAEKGLPSTKITGKWVFPQHLVEQWIEANTINYPKPQVQLPPYHGLLIISGSNDPLLEKTITLFNKSFTDQTAVFGNLGSLGGLKALKKNHCHIASSHLVSGCGSEYNFESATQELEQMPAVVNFCKRQQGILLQKGNPKKIKSFEDLAKSQVQVANRPLGTGTRLLFDRELAKHEIACKNIKGYETELHSHLDLGLEILSGKADAGIGVKAVAARLGLDFIPLRWERYDLMIHKDRFFDKGVQMFLGLLLEDSFRGLMDESYGYDLESSGKMVYPNKTE